MKKSIITAAVLSSVLLTGCASTGGKGMTAIEQGDAVQECKANGLSSVVYSTKDATVSKISCYPVEKDIAREIEVDKNGNKLGFWLWLIL